MHTAQPFIRTALTRFHVPCINNNNVFALATTKTAKRYISLSRHLRVSDETIEIGGVSKKLRKAKDEELVPTKYGTAEIDQSTLKRLRWMLQKDSLGQDMFLIGPPGPEKFRLAHIFAQLINQEVEYVALSRDTTESDLKQRREIQSGTAFFEDQAAVRAALNGRILILDGIEKAERNVLPVLNNLLENREMPLEDGRFLISSTRFDKLLETSNPEELEKWNLLRVDEKFRVIALGLPVPKYRGHPLDPPLRSRFQGLNVGPKTFKDQLLGLRLIAPTVPEESVLQLNSFAYAVNAPESKAQGLPDFPIDSLPLAVKLLASNPKLTVDQVLRRLYPYKSFMTRDGQSMVEDLMKNLSIERDSDTIPISSRGETKADYVANDYHDHVIDSLEESIRIHDICLIGPRGSGKSTLVKQLAARLTQDIEPIMLYQDMTARDLLQQRSTMPNGDTVWRPSALLNAAMEGKLAVLDGLHRLNTGTLFTISSLIHEREAQLFDGSRILRHDRYDDIRERMGLSDEEMAQKKIFKIHQDFRIVALAEPPSAPGKASSQWMTPEILSMFLYTSLRPMTAAEETLILEKLIGDALPPAMHRIIDLAQTLRNSADPTLNSLAASLSTRQLLRLAKRLKEYPMSDARDLVERACLTRFLPRLPQEALIKAIEESEIFKETTTPTENQMLRCSVEDGMLTIGRTTTPIYNLGNQAKVPDVVFYDTDQHLRVLELLLQDFLLGDHLLLIGNQGVGKNRLIDRLLALMNRPREYIQLHRDTTVQSLTVQPTVHGGLVTYQDSPLVRAARDGSILIVDEADKAPVQVTCILKTLIENGEMLLADGRRILPLGVKIAADESNIIRLHPDFRCIVLANRPGFPFLGNDFFASLGDLFSVHAVENPSLESEIELLRNFGPSLQRETLRSLVQAFSQLRTMADEGQLNYPYSTREVINIVKHLERYPKDGIVRTVSNVFDFDAYSTEIKEMITKVFHEHGIPLGASADNVALAIELPLTPPVSGGEWKFLEPMSVLSTRQPVGITGSFSARGTSSSLTGTEARLLWFTEQKTNWKLPLGEVQNVHRLAVDQEKGVAHILTTSPSVLYSFDVGNNRLVQTPMDRFLDSAHFLPQSRLQMTMIKDHLAIYDPDISKLVLFNPSQQTAQIVDLKASSTTSLGRLSQKWIGGRGADAERMLMAGALPGFNKLVFYQPKGHRIEVFELGQSESVLYELDFDIQSAFIVMNDRVIIQRHDSNEKYLFDVELGQLRSIDETEPVGPVTSDIVHHPNGGALFTLKGHYGALMAIPENTVQLWPGLKGSDPADIALLPEHNLVVRSIPLEDIPRSIDRRNASGFLQVADLTNQTLRYIPLPVLEQRRRYGRTDTIHLAFFDNNAVITVDVDGRIRLWEVNQSQLAKSLDTWRTNLGENGGKLEIKISKPRDDPTSIDPKVGKIDPNNTPHVGGNTWAGGSGGSGTAGLGGRGGPYRLDSGHNVFQVSDEDKDAVPEEVRRAAREMGEKAYQERLKQIRMSKFDGELYQRFSTSVEKQVKALRVILSNLQAKGKERQWMKHQTYGDLDETKIIEGLTGEKNIYRRRAERHPELGTPAEKPKHLRLLVDVSGSMYRFDGYDKRLEREMAATLLFMEALEGHSERWRYDIIGHSGETLKLDLVNAQQPPKDEKQRLDVLLNMHAHAQFCMSGDHTLEAVKQSITALDEADDIDEAFVILLSDANLDRYGIPAHYLVKALTATENVRAAAVFIGSLGDQATRLSQKMPAGSAYVCMDLEKLPQILQQIFTSVLLTG